MECNLSKRRKELLERQCVIEHETLLERELRHETNQRAERDLMRVSALDTSVPYSYEGKGKDGQPEWKSWKKGELENVRNQVEARLARTFVRTTDMERPLAWEYTRAIVKAGRETVLQAGKVVRVRL